MITYITANKQAKGPIQAYEFKMIHAAYVTADDDLHQNSM